MFYGKFNSLFSSGMIFKLRFDEVTANELVIWFFLGGGRCNYVLYYVHF